MSDASTQGMRTECACQLMCETDRSSPLSYCDLMHLDTDFRQVHDATAPTIGQLRMVGMTKGDDQAREDSLLFVLRQALEALEQDVEGMFALVYQIQAFALAADPGDASSASANLTSLRPQIQRAQDHVSQAVDAYQAELLSKRELLYEFVAETYDTQEFCDRWSRLDEVCFLCLCLFLLLAFSPSC